MNETDAILLIGHGSREPLGNEEFRTLAREFAAEAPGRRVEAAFIELCDPAIAEGIRNCARGGSRRIAVAPVIHFAAGHVKGDIPDALRESRKEFPDLAFTCAAPIGAHPAVLEILEERVREIEPKAGAVPRGESAVLLVGRGSSDPEANAELYRVARLFWERSGFGFVEACFVGVARPDYPEGVRRCVALGARAVHILPYFLFHGVLMTRLQKELDADLRPAHPGAALTLGRPFGPHPKLRGILRDRLREAGVSL